MVDEGGRGFKGSGIMHTPGRAKHIVDNTEVGKSYKLDVRYE